MLMEFVSGRLRNFAGIGIAVAMAANIYASSYVQKYVDEASDPIANACQHATQAPPYGPAVFYDSQAAPYSFEPTIRTLPPQYFPLGVVAFTIPEDGEIAMPSLEKAPYENGVQSWGIVLAHEKMHNYIHRAGGIQDERGINNFVAYSIGPRYGTDRFPFASY